MSSVDSERPGEEKARCKVSILETSKETLKDTLVRKRVGREDF